MTMLTSPRILIVDDETAIRESLAEFLEDFDFDVTTAESAEEGLSHLREGAFDVIIVDLRLPKMSGDALILKAHQMNASRHFLIHTGSVHYRLPDELTRIGMGAENVYHKPISDLFQLIDDIRKLLKEDAS